MAYSKHRAFEEADRQLAAWAKALSHPARIAILKELAARKTCICGDIVEVLPLAQATVSQHLKALKEAGLVEGTIDGPRSCYCINAAALAQVTEQLSAFFEQLRSDSLCC